ncbi:hypothetical protein AAFF_G00400360 [Aldrovandia affinis]|uniref:Secreted protein n=1 Tax=Aldrovandia affinis TaxID=143900 RepID=A0AAD7SCT2_9TELE|nr:hypothetical protein AAFF_G00400360 [Aldrovandia affinis]
MSEDKHWAFVCLQLAFLFSIPAIDRHHHANPHSSFPETRPLLSVAAPQKEDWALLRTPTARDPLWPYCSLQLHKHVHRYDWQC